MFGIEKDFQNLMEQVYGPLNKDKMTEMYGGNTPIVPDETDAEWELEEKLRRATEKVMNSNKQSLPDTIEIGGVKYKRVETPQSFYDKLEEWIEILNFTQSKEHKDLLVIEILNIVKEFIPEPYEGVGLSEYFLGYNEAIRKMEEKLK